MGIIMDITIEMVTIAITTTTLIIAVRVQMIAETEEVLM